MKVYLNPGHDRLLDSGAVNAALNLRECDLAYELAEAVQAYLERNGVAVVLGQSDDLYAVCGQANAAEADVFVSLHFNAFNKRATGTETPHFQYAPKACSWATASRPTSRPSSTCPTGG